MLDLRGDLGLALEALAEVLVPRQLGGDHLVATARFSRRSVAR